jgi:hypothetical protein
MDAAIRHLSEEDGHAYGIAVRGHMIAHVWWDADPLRRDAVGWYVRDLRTPAQVVRLHLADRAIDDLAADRRLDDDTWRRTAEETARRSSQAALADAQYTIRDTPYETYEIHVAGARPGSLPASFPGLDHRRVSDVDVLTGRLNGSELADVLSGVRGTGGTVTAVVRVRPELR